MVTNTRPPPMTMAMYSPNNPWGKKIVWKSWFAWYPVKVKGQWQWMKRVYRYRPWSLFSRFAHWEYGDIFDVLSENNTKPSPPPGRILNH